MKNIQTLYLKIIVLVSFPILSFCKTPSQSIRQADSLFRLKQYTQSFEIYHSVLQTKAYTPAMLLKMAYIQEGLGHIGQCIYFLNLYQLASHDEQALEKIDELAAKYKLEGYQTSDSSQFLSFIRKNTSLFTPALAALLVLMVALVVYFKKRNQKAWGSFACLVLLSGVLLFIADFTTPPQKVIVENNSTYLMNGPSAGASVVSIISEGHQLKVTGKKDVWLRVQWLDQDLYVKQSQVLAVEL